PRRRRDRLGQGCGRCRQQDPLTGSTSTILNMRTALMLALVLVATQRGAESPLAMNDRGAESPAPHRGMARAFQARDQNTTLTAVEGLKVGHHTLAERPTGCTVILVDGDASGGVSQRGGAPGTRETDLLNPLNMVDKVNAIVLAGGSAFGLEAATGTVRWLEEHNIGWPAGVARVPIVPAAILFDLGVGGNPKIRPTADCGYKAAEAATAAAVQEGTIGAGAGATVGKFGGAGRSTKSGIGTASIALPNGLIVAAIVAVNAVGDVVDPATGKVVAGVRNPDGTVADARKILRSGANTPPPRAGENTTIGVLATNAKL